jgi:hypothetical protein|tara:strand:+ start:3280 stop:3483 length:204 start_codon:yes stop_codon:yes gene_type:complete
MTKKIKVGDRVYYRAPRIADRKKGSKPEFTVIKLYEGGTMAMVKHDNGYIYSGYIVSNMTKEADWVK